MFPNFFFVVCDVSERIRIFKCLRNRYISAISLTTFIVLFIQQILSPVNITSDLFVMTFDDLLRVFIFTNSWRCWRKGPLWKNANITFFNCFMAQLTGLWIIQFKGHLFKKLKNPRIKTVLGQLYKDLF